LKLFKLNNSNSKILMITAKEVEAFRDLKEIFNTQMNAFNDKDKPWVTTATMAPTTSDSVPTVGSSGQRLKNEFSF